MGPPAPRRVAAVIVAAAVTALTVTACTAATPGGGLPVRGRLPAPLITLRRSEC